MIITSESFVVDPIISVVIITYNQELYVSETIESILNQNANVDYEIIIGEDYSSDNTREICKEYQSKYPKKIKLVLQNRNVGLLENYKNVLQQCRGKYIAQCAGDDFWNDGLKLQKQYDYIESNSKLGLIHADYYKLRYNQKSIINYHGGTLNFNELLKHNHICAATVFFRKDILDRYFEFIANKYYEFKMEDYPLWLYISRFFEIGHIQEPLATYRQLDESVSNIKDPRKDIIFQLSVSDIKKFYIETFKVDKSCIINDMRTFYIGALHVCFTLEFYSKYDELKIALNYWSIHLNFFNYLRLVALKDKYRYRLIKLFFLLLKTT